MRRPPPFVLVTGNPHKVREAARILGFRPPTRDLALPEIQELSLTAVLHAKGEAAWQRLARPLVVEETGLELDALRGFPGPLVKWMLAAVGVEGIARTAHALGDPQATARCALLYRDAERTVVAEGESRGSLTLQPRGRRGFGWDPVFVPEGSRATFGELPERTKDDLGHRGRAWRKLLDELPDIPR